MTYLSAADTVDVLDLTTWKQRVHRHEKARAKRNAMNPNRAWLNRLPVRNGGNASEIALLHSDGAVTGGRSGARAAPAEPAGPSRARGDQ